MSLYNLAKVFDIRFQISHYVLYNSTIHYNLLVWANTQSSGDGKLACSVREVTTAGYLYVSSAYSLLPCSFLIKIFRLQTTSYTAVGSEKISCE
jgi:hypothetical protein